MLLLGNLISNTHATGFLSSDSLACAGNARKLPAAATRKWARQVRWQERASQDGAASEAAADGNAADGKSRPALNPRLVAAMQRAQRTDK